MVEIYRYTLEEFIKKIEELDDNIVVKAIGKRSERFCFVYVSIKNETNVLHPIEHFPLNRYECGNFLIHRNLAKQILFDIEEKVKNLK